MGDRQATKSNAKSQAVAILAQANRVQAAKTAAIGPPLSFPRKQQMVPGGGEAPPEVEEELEVTHAIYGEVSAQFRSPSCAKDSLEFQVDLQPRVEHGAVLVVLSQLVRLPVGYPAAAAPRFAAERSRGLADAGVSSVLTAWAAATEEHGLQDFGCISPFLVEVSEALDITRGANERNNCLAPCGSSEPAVHTACDHVFHAACLCHWVCLQGVESAKAAA